MRIDKTAWKEATWAFLLSRLVIIVLTYVGSADFPLLGGSGRHNCGLSPQDCFLSWLHFDVFSYIGVASYGYTSARDTAFFPLWPLLIRSLGLPLGGSTIAYYIAGLILANLFFYLALVVLYKLIIRAFDAQVAQKALFFLAFYPYALFFFAGYTESLFLLLILGTFLFLQRAGTLDWWLAGLCGYFAAMTRSMGILLSVPFLVVYVQHFLLPGRFKETGWRQKIAAFAPLLLIALGLITYMLYLGYTMGNPLLFSVAEATSWHRPFVPPWTGFYYAIRSFFVSPWPNTENIMDLAFTVIPMLVLALSWRRLPLHYSLFALVMMIFPLCYIQGTTLTAVPRYMLVVFPLIIGIAVWKRAHVDMLYLALALPLFALNVILFVNHYWVA
jgi:Mannosyltransferase (PIG-V)